VDIKATMDEFTAELSLTPLSLTERERLNNEAMVIFSGKRDILISVACRIFAIWIASSIHAPKGGRAHYCAPSDLLGSYKNLADWATTEIMPWAPTALLVDISGSSLPTPPTAEEVRFHTHNGFFYFEWNAAVVFWCEAVFQELLRRNRWSCQDIHAWCAHSDACDLPNYDGLRHALSLITPNEAVVIGSALDFSQLYPSAPPVFRSGGVDNLFLENVDEATDPSLCIRG
jgi:hypothetical protein